MPDTLTHVLFETPLMPPTLEPSGVDLIAAERARQIRAEGHSAAWDDGFEHGDLAMAAATYALPAGGRRSRWLIEAAGDPVQSPACAQPTVFAYWYTAESPQTWPWAPGTFKPSPEDRVRELVKAGALIAAEIDRLRRAEGTEATAVGDAIGSAEPPAQDGELGGDGEPAGGTDRYVEEVLVRAEEGDWRQVLAEVARGRAGDVEIGHGMVRRMQAAFAAGVVHGPEVGYEWLGNALAGPGLLPLGDSPDPQWYSDAAWARFGEWPPVPENCATGCEPGTAPATQVRGSTVGAFVAVDGPGGRRWNCLGNQVLVEIDHDGQDSAGDVSDQLAQFFAGLDQAAAVELEPWQPDLGEVVEAAEVHLSAIDAHAVVLCRADGGHVFVSPHLFRAAVTHRPTGCDEFVTEQLGDGTGPIRFRSGDHAWGYLAPLRRPSQDSDR
jgi:hypothetical protein